MSQVSFNNYDSEQYQMLMANFQQLIESTQNKLKREEHPNFKDVEDQIQKINISPLSERNKVERQDYLQSTPLTRSYSPSKILQRSLYINPDCPCGLKDTVLLQQKEIQELRIKLELTRPLDIKQLTQEAENRPGIHSEYLQDLLTEIAQKDQSIRHMTSAYEGIRLEYDQLVEVYQQEQLNHHQTQLKLTQLQNNFDHIRSQLSEIETREFQISDKLTKEYSDLVIDNIQLKEQNEKLIQQLNKYSVALSQYQLNIQQEQRRQVNTFAQTDDSQNHGRKTNRSVEERTKKSESVNQSFLNASLLKDSQDENIKGKNMRLVLKEKLERAQNTTEKFVTLFLEQKKMRNKSQNEVKFYTELGKMLEKIKENQTSLHEGFIQYTNEQDQKEEFLRHQFELTLSNVNMLKENCQIEIQNHQDMLSKKDEHIEKLQSEINKLNEKKNKLSKEKETLSQELSQTTKERNQLSERNDLLDKKCKSKDLQINDLQNQLDEIRNDLDSQIQNLRRELNELKRVKLSLDNDKASLLFDIEQARSQIMNQENQLTTLKMELDDRSNKLRSTTDQLRQKSQELLQIKDEYERTRIEYQDLLQQDYRVTQQNQELQKEKQRLNDSVDKFNDQNMELNDKAHSLERKIGQLMEENKNLKEHLIEMENQLEEKIAENNALQNEVEELHHHLQNISGERDSYKDQVNKIQEDQGRLVKELRTHELQLKDKSLELDKYQGETNYKTSRISQLEKEIQHLNQSNIELQSSYHATQQELRLLQDYNDNTQAQIEKLKAQNKQLTQQMKEKDGHVKDAEHHLKLLEQKHDKERASVHADYQHKYGMFQSKIMLQEDEIKTLKAKLVEAHKNLQTLKGPKDKDNKQGNWEELLETSYYYNKQCQIKIKVLTQETQRLSQLSETQRDKITDLEAFIERMIELSEDNRLLAKQILVEQYEKSIKQQASKKPTSPPREDVEQYYDSAGTFGQNDSSVYEFRTPSTKKGRD